MTSPLVEAWLVNNDMNLMLLESLTPEGLAAQYSPRTRTVAAQFAHMHNVRIYHLEKRGPAFLGRLEAFERGAQPTKAQLRKALKASAAAIAAFLAECDAKGKVKSWNRTPTTYLAYFVSHESHHRGLALVSLRLSGVKVPKEVTYGLWYWRKKQKE